MTRPALLFYCQHSVGMGHLMRSLALTRALAARFDVTLVVGGRLPKMAAADRHRVVELPPVGLDENGALASRDRRRRLDRAQDLRRRILLDTFREIRPQAVVVELFPFGRHKFTSELEPMLAEARAARPRPIVCCSLRDLLVSRLAKQNDHDARAVRMLTSYFDAVLVHSDPAFATIEESLAAGVRVPVEVHHTGFVHDTTAVEGSRPRIRRPSVIVSAGGGLVGEPLLQTALEAQSLILAKLRRPMTIVAGPFLPEDTWRRLRQVAGGTPETAIRRSVPNLALEMRSALGSISQCGYNTAMDLIDSGVPALVVPFGDGAEDEQLKRARRLEASGVLRVLLPSELSPTRLADEMTTLTSFVPAAAKLNLHGARNTADILAAMVHHRAGGATSMRRTA